MRILFVASGSGGHIYPAYSLLKEAKKKHQVGYLMIKNSLEERIITDDDIERVYLDVETQAQKYWKNPKKVISLFQKIALLEKKIKDYDAVIAFGGFITFVAAWACKKGGVKLYIHEQNALLGDANAFSLSKARYLFSSFEHIEIPTRYQHKLCYCGNPRVDEALLKRRYQYSPYPLRILFMAGSLGSSSLLNIMREVTLDKRLEKCHFLVVTGNNNYQKYACQNWGMNTTLRSYLNDALYYMSIQSLIIMRAGATSIMEVRSLAIPSLLIPSPYVKHNHQLYNAQEMEKEGYAFLLEERKLTCEGLISFILNLLDKPDILKEMHQKMINIPLIESQKTMMQIIENDQH